MCMHLAQVRAVQQLQEPGHAAGPRLRHAHHVPALSAGAPACLTLVLSCVLHAEAPALWGMAGHAAHVPTCGAFVREYSVS